MNLNVNVDHVVRSLAIAVVGLPVALSLSGTLNTTNRLLGDLVNEDVTKEVTNVTRRKLVEPCYDYVMSKNDSKLERESKNIIDDVMGGEVNHREVCRWVLN
jgi:hypothetical protein